MVNRPLPWGLWITALRLLTFALVCRVVAAWILGEGAPFGPDGTGAQASFVLGGHPYPLHMVLLHLTGGDVRALSLITSALSAVLVWVWGRRVGLGGGGGWLSATLPVCVMSGALAGGDAPAIAVVLAGAVLSTFGGPWVIAGGLLAALSVAVKPIALPALVLLLARPWSLLGALPTLVVLNGFVQPLWKPIPDGGILGTWWISSGGSFPPDVFSWVLGGVQTIWTVPLWSGVVLLVVVAVTAWQMRDQLPLALTGCATVMAAWGTAALFGDRMEVRYLTPVMWAALPFVGRPLVQRRGLLAVVCVALVWPTSALMTQLAAYRTQQDPMAQVPALPVVPFPVDVRPVFDACSTPDATRMRLLAGQIADVAPQGATITTPARPDGREGELFWPLQVLRPDIRVQPETP